MTTRSTGSRTSGRSSGPEGPRSFGFRELSDEARRVTSSRRSERQVQRVVGQGHGKIMEGRDDLPPGAFRGNPRDLGDDEVLGPEAFLRNNPFLNLASPPPATPDPDRKRPALPHASPSRRRPVPRSTWSRVTWFVRSRSGRPRLSAGRTRSPA